MQLPTGRGGARRSETMHLKAKREYLRVMVAEKNRWSERRLTEKERALGFLGWHERGYLPHCDFPNLVQFLTIRLDDSMPAARRGEWEHWLEIEDVRERRLKLEEYLDRGVGECPFRIEHIARIAEDALQHFHNDRYELLAWCVMPNHIHVLVNVRLMSLSKIVQNWKIRMENQTRKNLGAGAPSTISACGRYSDLLAGAVPGAPIEMAARVLGHVHARRRAGTEGRQIY